MPNLFLIGVLSLAVMQTKGASGGNLTIQNNPSKTSGSFRAYANIDDVESLIWEKY